MAAAGVGPLVVERPNNGLSKRKQRTKLPRVDQAWNPMQIENVRARNKRMARDIRTGKSGREESIRQLRTIRIDPVRCQFAPDSSINRIGICNLHARVSTLAVRDQHSTVDSGRNKPDMQPMGRTRSAAA
jgi:hypothetical protein